MGGRRFLRAVRENVLGMVLASVGAAGTVVSTFQLWLPSWAIKAVGVVTVLLILGAAVCFVWFKGDQKCKWRWERPLLEKALGEEEDPLLCGRQYTGRAQGRALACAVGVYVVDSLSYVCKSLLAVSAEMLLETDFDLGRLAVHCGSAEKLHGQVAAVGACPCVQELSTLYEHAEDSVRERAKVLRSDIESLMDDVRGNVLVPLQNLLRDLLKKAQPGTPLSNDDKMRIQEELKKAGAFLSARCSVWLVPVLQKANELVVSLRRRWQKDRDAVRVSAACTPIDLALG